MEANAGDTVEEPGPFDIYETEDGPRQVTNPVRRLILAKMRGRELTVPEIIAATALTKSTISTHLAVLGRGKMVSYREDPIDRRRKRYFLTARHVATSRRCADRLPVMAAGEDDPADAPDVLPRVLLRSLLSELSGCGLDVAPLVHETGRRVGEIVARDRHAADLDAFGVAAAEFWASAGLGSLSAHNDGNLVVRIDDCRLCCAVGPSRIGLCGIAAGILQGMAAQALRANVEVIQQAEAEAVADDDGCGCSFRIRVHAPLAGRGAA